MASRQHERVQERAYHLWQEGGGEHGRAVDHWLQAEREIGTEADRAAPKRKAPPKAASAKAPPKAAKPGPAAKEASPGARAKRPAVTA